MIAFLVDTSAAQTFLRGLHADQIPYAASRAVNATARDVQAAVRQRLGQAFILRRRSFIDQSVLIPRYSNKGDMPIRADVVIGRRAAFLWKFETGAPKLAAQPDAPVAIPTSQLRPQRQALVPLALYPKNLRLLARRDVHGILGAQRHVTRRGVVQLQGKRRTFVLDPHQHFGVRTWGVWQRVGPRRSDIRLIWVYKERIPTPRILQFHETAEAMIRRMWGPHFAQFFAEAARTASRPPLRRVVAA